MAGPETRTIQKVLNKIRISSRKTITNANLLKSEFIKPWNVCGSVDDSKWQDQKRGTLDHVC